MTRTLHARYDGEALHPEEPLPIAPETRVLVTIEMGQKEGGGCAEDESNPYAFLDVLRSLHLEGPPDWSQRVNHDLYGSERPEND